MADGIESVGNTIKQHPLIVIGAIAVVLLLILISRSGQQTATFAGGGAAAPIDPNAAAISEAAISAGQANLTEIAQLIGANHASDDDLASTLGQSHDALSASLAQTSAARDVSLAQTSAARDVSLEQIASNERTTNYSTSVAAGVANNQTAAQLTAAQLTAANNRAAIDYQNQQALAALQTTKDVARAQDNTSIVDNVVNVVGGVVKALTFGLL
jgi:hypothetical protein